MATTCRKRSSSRPRGPKPPVFRHPEHVLNLAQGQTEFAWKLYKACRAQPTLQPSGNLCFSPLLLHQALTMGYMGARYESAASLRDVLHLSRLENDASVNLAYADVTRSLLACSSEPPAGASPPPFVLHTATRLYVPITHCLLDQFGAALRTHYGGDIGKVPFHTDKERARQEINQWVEEATQQTVRDLLRPLALATFVSVVLASAAYFRPIWDRAFFAGGKTTVGSFHPSPEEVVHVTMLRAKAHFRHGTVTEADCRLLELPFAGDRFVLLLFLPNQVDKGALEALEDKLGAPLLARLDDFLRKGKVQVALPLLAFDEPLSLGKLLQGDSDGVAKLFARGKANFSGISGNNNLHLSHIEHKVRFELEGLRRQGPKAPPAAPKDAKGKMEKSRLEFDRPFVFMVRDVHLNMFLLMGCVRKLEPFNPE